MKRKEIIQAIGISLVAVALSAGTTYASINFGGGNGTTGPNSENENEVEFSNDADIAIDNTADAVNDYALDVSTGEGSFAQNTAIGDIFGGDIFGDVDVCNNLNSGDIDLGPAFGDFGLNIIDLGNDLTGPESMNDNEVEISQNRDIAISNDAEISNDVALDMTSGDNCINHNTVVGDVVSGDVHFDGAISNVANAGMGSVDLGGLGFNNVNADFENHLTGPNSENTNQLEINNDTNVAISNTANISNDVAIAANTGGNTIGHNTCVGDVVTGNVNVGFGIHNIAN